MTMKDDALLKIPSEVPCGKDVPFQDITVMSFSEAKALDDITLGAHVFALGSEFVKRAGSAVKFVQIHRSAIQELRKRYSKQGRRSPVPGCPSWGEFVTSVFKVSQQYMNSLLVSPYPKQLGAKKPAKRKDAAVSTNLSVIQRVWTKLFQDGRYTMPPAAKKGVISRFVNELNDDDFELVATAVAVRIGRIGKEKAKETGESAAKVQEATRVEAATERVRESIAVLVAQTDETEKEKAAAKVKYSNGYICPSGHTHYVNCISKDGLPMELPCGFVDNSLTPCVLASRRMTAKEKWAEDKARRERLAAIVAEEKETLADIRQQEKAAAV